MNSEYVEFLKSQIFKTSDFNQFELFFDSIAEFLTGREEKVAILERSYIYGGRSIFAPLVTTVIEPIVIDYRPNSAESRANYQGAWIDDSGYEFKRNSESIVDLGTGYHFSFSQLAAETLLIPNLLHHCRDFLSLMGYLQAALPSLRRVYVFDSYLREEHQAPDDFCRYTPTALALTMRKLGFGNISLRETGNIFDGLLYLISQARCLLEKTPELAELRSSINAIVPSLQAIRRDERYRTLGRPHAFLSTAYAMSFER